MAKINKKDFNKSVLKDIRESLESCQYNDYNPFHFYACKNIVSNANYRGYNALRLSFDAKKKAFKTGVYGTFKQLKTLGYNVNKGQRASYVMRPRSFKDKDDNFKVAGFSAVAVFNIEQTDISDDSLLQYMPESLDDSSDIDTTLVKEFIAAIPANIQYNVSTETGFYNPSKDYIGLPPIGLYKSESRFYKTLLHELGHWTGNKTRLNRFDTESPKKDYAAEELVAELTAAILASKLGISNESMTKGHAYYVKSWLQALKKDDSFLDNALLKASKAVDLLDNFYTDSLQNMHKKSA